jgi:Ni,Fe-hydrogenase III large subunit
VLQSIEIIQSLLNEPIETERASKPSMRLGADSFVVTLNEAWRGELSHCVLTDAGAGFCATRSRTLLSTTGTDLAMSLRDTGISDFPLNNKSYNLSYCGFDLNMSVDRDDENHDQWQP